MFTCARLETVHTLSTRDDHCNGFISFAISGYNCWTTILSGRRARVCATLLAAPSVSVGADDGTRCILFFLECDITRWHARVLWWHLISVRPLSI